MFVARTPAGGRLYTWWEHLDQARKLLPRLVSKTDAANVASWHVLFRFGTVVRATGAPAPEFDGHPPGVAHACLHDAFPSPSSVGVLEQAMDSNQIVWEAQKNVSGQIGLAIRRAYAQLLSEGYPDPERDQPPERIAIRTALTAEGAGNLWCVRWLYPDVDIYNMIFTPFPAANTREVARLAKHYRGRDCAFPEVAAVVTHDCKAFDLSRAQGCPWDADPDVKEWVYPPRE